MRLLFNATNLRSEGGVILMERMLAEMLAYTGPDGKNPPLHMLLYHNPELGQRIQRFIEKLPEETQNRLELVPLRKPDGWQRFFWEQVSLPKIIRDKQVDVLFSFGNTGPLFPGCRQILYLQQSIPHSQFRPKRHYFKWLRFQWLYGFLINLAQLGSQRIIIPTQWTIEPMRQSILYKKPLDAYRVSLPGLPALDTDSREGAPPKELNVLQQITQWKEAGDKILLYPCFLSPYKNIPALLEAIRKISDDTPSFKLVLTFNGESQEYFPCKQDVMAVVSKCPRKQVVLAGTLSRGTLAKVYAMTDMLIFPSLVETLGLPLLEALSLGIPIVAMDGESVGKPTEGSFAKEICQDAALYAPPGKPQALADQIQRLLKDENLAKELSQNGLKRASQLSWTEHIRQILDP